MSARTLRRPVTIALDVDPDLVPSGHGCEYPRRFKLRLVPCKGGVRIDHSIVCGIDVDASKEDAAYRLADLAVYAAQTSADMRRLGGLSFWGRLYYSDRANFYLTAAQLCLSDARIAALWGDECAD